MNNNIEILNKLKESLKTSLKSFMTFADNSANYTEVTTMDGKKLQVVGEVAVNSEIYMLDETGVQTPIEDGEYMLDNGLTIKVMANKIEEVASTTETPETEVETEMEEMPASPEDTTDTESDTTGNDKMAALEEKVAMLEEAIQSIMDFINTQGEANQQMMSRIEKIADSPAAEPIKQTKKVHTLASNSIVQSDMDEIRKMKALLNDKGVKFPG